MLFNFDEGQVTLTLEAYQVERFENFLRLEVRKTRLFQSERERFLEEKHEQLQRELTKIRELAKATMTVDRNETIGPLTYKLAERLRELSDTLLGEWEILEGDEHAHEQSNTDRVDGTKQPGREWL